MENVSFNSYTAENPKSNSSFNNIHDKGVLKDENLNEIYDISTKLKSYYESFSNENNEILNFKFKIKNDLNILNCYNQKNINPNNLEESVKSFESNLKNSVKINVNFEEIGLKNNDCELISSRYGYKNNLNEDTGILINKHIDKNLSVQAFNAKFSEHSIKKKNTNMCDIFKYKNYYNKYNDVRSAISDTREIFKTSEIKLNDIHFYHFNKIEDGVRANITIANNNNNYNSSYSNSFNSNNVNYNSNNNNMNNNNNNNNMNKNNNNNNMNNNNNNNIDNNINSVNNAKPYEEKNSNVINSNPFDSKDGESIPKNNNVNELSEEFQKINNLNEGKDELKNINKDEIIKIYEENNSGLNESNNLLIVQHNNSGNVDNNSSIYEINNEKKEEKITKESCQDININNKNELKKGLKKEKKIQKLKNIKKVKLLNRKIDKYNLNASYLIMRNYNFNSSIIKHNIGYYSSYLKRNLLYKLNKNMAYYKGKFSIYINILKKSPKNKNVIKKKNIKRMKKLNSRNEKDLCYSNNTCNNINKKLVFQCNINSPYSLKKENNIIMKSYDSSGRINNNYKYCENVGNGIINNLNNVELYYNSDDNCILRETRRKMEIGSNYCDNNYFCKYLSDDDITYENYCNYFLSSENVEKMNLSSYLKYFKILNKKKLKKKHKNEIQKLDLNYDDFINSICNTNNKKKNNLFNINNEMENIDNSLNGTSCSLLTCYDNILKKKQIKTNYIDCYKKVLLVSRNKFQQKNGCSVINGKLAYSYNQGDSENNSNKAISINSNNNNNNDNDNNNSNSINNNNNNNNGNNIYNFNNNSPLVNKEAASLKNSSLSGFKEEKNGYDERNYDYNDIIKEKAEYEDKMDEDDYEQKCYRTTGVYDTFQFSDTYDLDKNKNTYNEKESSIDEQNILDDNDQLEKIQESDELNNFNDNKDEITECNYDEDINNYYVKDEVKEWNRNGTDELNEIKMKELESMDEDNNGLDEGDIKDELSTENIESTVVLPSNDADVMKSGTDNILNNSNCISSTNENSVNADEKIKIKNKSIQKNEMKDKGRRRKKNYLNKKNYEIVKVYDDIMKENTTNFLYKNFVIPKKTHNYTYLNYKEIKEYLKNLTVLKSGTNWKTYKIEDLPSELYKNIRPINQRVTGFKTVLLVDELFEKLWEFPLTDMIKIRTVTRGDQFIGDIRIDFYYRQSERTLCRACGRHILKQKFATEHYQRNINCWKEVMWRLGIPELHYYNSVRNDFFDPRITNIDNNNEQILLDRALILYNQELIKKATDFVNEELKYYEENSINKETNKSKGSNCLELDMLILDDNNILLPTMKNELDEPYFEISAIYPSNGFADENYSKNFCFIKITFNKLGGMVLRDLFTLECEFLVDWGDNLLIQAKKYTLHEIYNNSDSYDVNLRNLYDQGFAYLRCNVPQKSYGKVNLKVRIPKTVWHYWEAIADETSKVSYEFLDKNNMHRHLLFCSYLDNINKNFAAYIKNSYKNNYIFDSSNNNQSNYTKLEEDYSQRNVLLDKKTKSNVSESINNKIIPYNFNSPKTEMNDLNNLNTRLLYNHNNNYNNVEFPLINNIPYQNYQNFNMNNVHNSDTNFSKNFDQYNTHPESNF